MYNNRIEDILSCKVCKCYDEPAVGAIQNSTPIQCIHLFHPLCVTIRNYHSLTIGNHEGHPNECFFCSSIISDKYTDLYDYD